MSIAMIQAFKKTGLPPTERLVAYMLADHHNADTGRCDPSFETLEEETGLCRRTLGRAVARLEKMGHITLQKRKGTRHSYSLHPALRVPTQENKKWTESPMSSDFDDTEVVTLSAGSSDTESHEPEGTVIMNRKEQEPAVLSNVPTVDPIVARLYAIIRRPITVPLSRDERMALRAAAISQDHLTAVESYFAAPHPEWNGKDYRYKSLSNLISKWSTAVTTALQWTDNPSPAKQSKPKTTPRDFFA